MSEKRPRLCSLNVAPGTDARLDEGPDELVGPGEIPEGLGGDARIEQGVVRRGCKIRPGVNFFRDDPWTGQGIEVEGRHVSGPERGDGGTQAFHPLGPGDPRGLVVSHDAGRIEGADRRDNFRNLAQDVAVGLIADLVIRLWPVGSAGERDHRCPRLGQGILGIRCTEAPEQFD